jgi:hypothetical protein
MDFFGTAQLTLGLGRFFGQDVAFESRTAFDGTTWTDAKALFSGTFRFHFRHSNSVFGTAPFLT